MYFGVAPRPPKDVVTGQHLLRTPGWDGNHRRALEERKIFCYAEELPFNPDGEVGISDVRLLLFVFNVLNSEDIISITFHLVPRIRRSFSYPSRFPA